MVHNLKLFLTVMLFTFLIGGNQLSAQEKDSRKALQHMESLLSPVNVIVGEQLKYIQTAARAKNINEVIQQRARLIRSVEVAILNANQTPPLDDDTSFKDAVLNYYNTLYSILREDYGRVVDLQKIAEESYDNMEAYLKAREEAGKKLEEAFTELTVAQKTFAGENNITLLESKENETTRKLRIAAEVLSYYNNIFLMNFKNYKQELYVIHALNREDLNAFEQNRQTLEKITEEAMESQKNLTAFKGDSSIMTAYRNNLEFYHREARDEFLFIADFLLYKERFLAMKNAFDQKKSNERTREEVEQYNQSITEMNQQSKKYNQINQKLNSQRSKLINLWNQNMSIFLAKHIPR